MSRFLYVGSLLALASSLAVSTSAQTSLPRATETTPLNNAANVAPGSARVQHFIVRGSDAAMEVEIQTSGTPVAPDTQAIAGPDRIIVDFPGTLPAADLRALQVNRGPLKAIRAGLFFNNPPITRIVLDLLEPQSYKVSTTQISATQHAVVLKLSPANPGLATAKPPKAPEVPAARAANLRNVSFTPNAAAGASVAPSAVPAADPRKSLLSLSALPTLPLQKLVTVIFENGMLRIRSEKATMAQVLFEVQQKTQAEIAIPAGAEQEEVIADLGPAPAQDVLASLLNGSPYNFIFVGDEKNLARVVLTRRNTSIF